jgi:peptidoglycan/LPS O-acetylase OafA/YrhL
VAFLAIVNGTLLGQDWTLFLAVQDGSLGWTSNFAVSDVPVWKGLLVPPAWTLGVELTFYLVAPWVVRRRRLLLALLALSLSARLAGVAMGFGAADPWTYRFFPFELALFLLGMISHQVVLPRWRRHLARRGRSNLPALGTYLLLAAIGVFPLIPAEDWAKRCALIVLLAGLAPLAFLFQQRSRVDQAVGELSFPLYIGHYLVLTVGIVVFPRIGPAHDVARFAVYVACSLGFAALLHVAVTRPVERVRARLRGSTKPQATSAPPA